MIQKYGLLYFTVQIDVINKLICSKNVILWLDKVVCIFFSSSIFIYLLSCLVYGWECYRGLYYFFLWKMNELMYIIKKYLYHHHHDHHKENTHFCVKKLIKTYLLKYYWMSCEKYIFPRKIQGFQVFLGFMLTLSLSAWIVSEK